uniref:Protein amnionless n=1 Tax=Setaria digitata TaxID=48799 RepID=A0A915Q384_9BILA
MKNSTFNDSLLWTVEGQLQFELGPKLKSMLSINGIHYQWPKFTNTITVLDGLTRKRSEGQFNSNLEPDVINLFEILTAPLKNFIWPSRISKFPPAPANLQLRFLQLSEIHLENVPRIISDNFQKLALICSYQQCQAVAQQCSQKFRPIGHCCEICCSMLRFRATTFNFDKFRNKMENYKRENKVVKEYGLDIAILRVDYNDSVPQYQVVVLAQDGTMHLFEERIYRQVLNELTRLIENDFEISPSLLMLEVEEVVSAGFRNLAKDNLMLAFIIFLVIVTVTIGIIVAVRRDCEFINFRGLFTQKSFYEAVVRWRSRKNEDELELLRNGGSASDTILNDAGASEISN